MKKYLGKHSKVTRCPYTLNKMVKTQNTTNQKHVKMQNSIPYGGDAKLQNCIVTLKDSQMFSYTIYSYHNSQ